MSTNNTMSTDDVELTSLLVRKREGLLARLTELRAEVQRLERVKRGIDDTLHLLGPGGNHRLPVRRKAGTGSARSGSLFAQGECLALMQQVLREAVHPLTTTELLRAVMAKKSLPASEEHRVRLSVRYVLRKDGIIGAGITVADPQASIPRWVRVVSSEKGAE